MWLLALLLKSLISRETFGTSNRLRLTVAWAAVAAGFLLVLDLAILVVLNRIHHWTAVSPHTTWAAALGVLGLAAYFSIRSELKVYRGYVDRARQ